MLFTAILAGCAQSPHEHTLVEVPRVEAEVGKDGNIEYWECTDCGKHFADAQGETEIAREDTVIPALEEPESPFTLADVYSWTGRNYPASEFTFGYNGTEDVTFTYDETALTLDAEAHTVKALKDGRYKEVAENSAALYESEGTDSRTTVFIGVLSLTAPISGRISMKFMPEKTRRSQASVRRRHMTGSRSCSIGCSFTI